MDKLNSRHSTTDNYSKQEEMWQLQFDILPPIKLPLIKRMYKEHYPSAKARKDELCVIGTLDGQISAVVRFKNIDVYRLLTGMLVLPENQKKGIGSQLLNYCSENILNNQDYCFAYAHLEPFYARHGFHSIMTEELPIALMQRFELYVSSGKDLIPMRYLG
ncbi:GNAT family N-acetyltransferase [Vibrio anguillarum]|uniref:GNAT family N-acetyltransferase n=1 Tax=Vibrio anguillarum TaxID=55601 RepID=UPI000B5476E3|nr:GNAT family N-acetyltransferase [Vibrio anguillarum]ASG06308.1 GNAT family N-acetyltransferase [Vibrio anguillarum]